MNYVDFDPYPMIRQRNEEMLREERALQLEQRLTHRPVNAKHPELRFRALLIEGDAERLELFRV